MVGSTYMAACGLTPGRKGSIATISETEFNAVGISLVTMIKFAVAMQSALDKINASYAWNFRLRIGIEYGPVIAGVVGAQKPLYDIWGDTVNMASRLEYTSKLGEIQVSFELLKNHFSIFLFLFSIHR